VTSQTLTPTLDVADFAGIDVTATAAAPTQATLLFANTGRERLYVIPGTSNTSETVQVNIEALVDGQTITQPTAVTLSNALHVYQFGPFHSVLDVSGTNQIQVTLSSTSNVTVALFQGVGVY
jgi:hypothetical protein